jgi:hypothetical protein
MKQKGRINADGEKEGKKQQNSNTKALKKWIGSYSSYLDLLLLVCREDDIIQLAQKSNSTTCGSKYHP